MKIGSIRSTRRLAGALGLLLAIALIVVLATSVSAVPGMPHRFAGFVTIDGAPAPAGTEVSARIGGEEYGAGVTDDQGRYGYGLPTFTVSADDPDTPETEGGVNGDTIDFYVKVGGYWYLSGSATFENGAFTRYLDLAAEVIEYELNISSTAGGNATEPGEGTFTYYAGTVVDLLAVPDLSFAFVEWTGNVGTVGNVTVADTNAN